MWDWIMKNKEWLFSGVAVAALTAGIGLLWPEENAPPAPQPGSTVQQTHSGSGDNVAGNKTVTTDNSVRQASISGDNIARDKIINNYLLGSVDYQQLMAEIKDAEELLAGIAPEKTSLRLKQSAKLEELRKQLADFKVQVFRIYEQITRIPINTERLRRAKAHFEKGEFREADAVLKAEEIERDVDRLKLEQTAAKDKLAAIEQDLADRANEFLLKAQLSLVTPLAEGEDRYLRTEGYFTQALAAARTAEVLHAYAVFLYQINAFSKAEPLYQEALQQLRRNAETEPKAFFPNVANTLNNLANLYCQTNAFGLALTAYQEALKTYRSLAEVNSEAFLPNVANTLNNLANLHSDTQDYGPALKEYEEALKLYRSLAEAEPKAFLPYVAQTLNNLAILHADTQAYGPALKEYEEALKIRRSLAEAEPKAFLKDVAQTLNNLANLHYQTQAYGPALKEYEEALKLYRSLAEAEPKVFLKYVAATLNNLANLHYQTQAYGPALKEFEEALKLYRSLAEAEPKAFLKDVAMTLNNLAALHYQTQAYGPALKEFEEALKIMRSLAEAEPKAFLPKLATTLINLSIFHLQAVPDKAKSVAYAQEARDILIPLCKQAPHLQQYLDQAEQLLAANKAKPSA